MKILPLFPLNLVLLPYEILPLHIFEPRYKSMVKNAIENEQPFGIVLKDSDGVYKKGCRVEVTKVLQKYPNGEYDIIVKGIERFKVLYTEKDGDTFYGQIEYIPLSIETAVFNLEAKAVTKAGQANLEANSGNIAEGTWFLIFSIKLVFSFSIKKTGTLFLERILFAKDVNL